MATGVRDGILSAIGMRDSGDKHSGGPRAFVSEGTAEDVNIGLDGHPERTYGDPVVQSVSDVAQETLLGESLLGQRVLRRHRRPR